MIPVYDMFYQKSRIYRRLISVSVLYMDRHVVDSYSGNHYISFRDCWSQSLSSIYVASSIDTDEIFN